MGSLQSGFSGQNSNRANAAFTIGLLTILAALSFEYIGGYVPCELCLAERWPYYIGLPLLAVVIGMWRRVPPPVRIVSTAVIMAIFLYSTYLGSYHAGVELGFWPGPTSCTGTGGGISFNDLNAINNSRVIPCDFVQWRFLGITFAGYNALISLLVAGLLGWSVLGQITRYQRDGN